MSTLSFDINKGVENWAFSLYLPFTYPPRHFLA